MISYATPKENKTLRLNITSVSGYFNLFLQFNCAEEKKEADIGAYKTLTLLLLHALRLKYKEKSLKHHGEEDFYKVTKTDNTDGFCLSIQWESVDTEQAALDIAGCALEYVLTFSPGEHSYANEEAESLIKSNLDKAKIIADTFKKDILDHHSFDFHKEYWSPFD